MLLCCCFFFWFGVRSVKKTTTNRERFERHPISPITPKDPIVAGISSTWLSHFSLTGSALGAEPEIFPVLQMFEALVFITCCKFQLYNVNVEIFMIMNWTKQVTSCASLGAHEYVHQEKEKQTAIVRISRTTFGFDFQMLRVQSHRIHV